MPVRARIQDTAGAAYERVKNSFRTLKVAIKLRGPIAKKNREPVFDASLRLA
jgi:hypothetical protein